MGCNGAGTLRITQPGTVFTMGPGATTIGESLGGVGVVVADTLAHVTTTGPFNVGVSGAGQLDVLGASAAGRTEVYPVRPAPRNAPVVAVGCR